jgi:multicomponent Na+:H+ antiporter subunit E
MIVLFILLLMLWVSLSGYFMVLPLVPGVIALFISVLLYKKVKSNSSYKFSFALNVYKFILYIPWLIKEILLSNYHVTKLILFKKPSPKIITLKNTLKTKTASVVFANSVTLTPGSIVLDANEEHFLIHALDKDIAEGMLSGALEKRIENLENRK